MEIDVVRAELERDELMLEHARLVRTLAESETRLSELWGDHAPGFDGVEGTLPGNLELPPLHELTAAMEVHPAWQLADAGTRLIQAEIDEARAEGVPELALSAGYLRNNELDEETTIAAASLSLPIFDRNQAAVAQKRHEMAGSEHEAAREHLERATSLATLYSEIQGTDGELTARSTKLVAKATRIHNVLEEFYSQGKTGILDLLEARRHLLELRMGTVDLIEQQALLGADLFELTGYKIEIIR
jgi:cobalt-zinc-cadmium efflux system outer membrane protein